MKSENAKMNFAVQAMALVLIVFSVLRLVRLVLIMGDNRFDDAYMFYRYAEHLLAGHGIRWNIDGPQTYGTTSLPYLFIVAACRAVFHIPPHPLMTLISCFFCLLALLTLTAVCWMSVRSDLLKKPLFIGGILFTTALSSQAFCQIALSGMDAMLAVFVNVLLIGSVVSMLKRPTVVRAAMAGIVAYLCYAVRIDQAIYACVFPVLMILLILKGRDRFRCLILWSMCSGVPVLLDLFWKIHTFGEVLPLPYYAKQVNFFTGYTGIFTRNPFSFFNHFIMIVTPFLILVAITFDKKNWKLFVGYLVPVVLTFVVLGSAIQIMGTNGRFYLPALPFIVMLGFLSLDSFVEGEISLLDGCLTLRLLAAVGILCILGSTEKRFWKFKFFDIKEIGLKKRVKAC